jgi:membrane-associated phospholipid phosphatase
MDALPRAYVCFSELMDRVSFDGSTASAACLSLRGASPARIVTLRRPSHDLFVAQLAQVHALSAERTERATEILAQLAPAAAWWTSVVNLRAQRHAKTLEFIDAVLNFTVTVIFRFKQQAGCPRPVEYSAQIQPLVATPGHDSWPSGHSTESFAVARVLAMLRPDAGPQLRAHAARIAQNREVAGVHFPTDSAAGAVLGDTLARFVIAVGQGGQAPEEVRSATFDPDRVYAERQGGARRLLHLDSWVDSDEFKGPQVWRGKLPASAAEAGYIAELWRQAQAEWA